MHISKEEISQKKPYREHGEHVFKARCLAIGLCVFVDKKNKTYNTLKYYANIFSCKHHTSIMYRLQQHELYLSRCATYNKLFKSYQYNDE